jgi:conjugative relaxase-like TrwC/TraI family protein
MLRINQQRSSKGAKGYFDESLGREDGYYTRGEEIVGRWGGKGADRLGLHGEVTKDAFHALCDNLNPVTGQKLTCRTKDNRSVAYDFTWNAPKSLSVLYTLTKDEKLLDAFRDSVRDTMAELETEAKTRVRKGGVNDERTTGNLVYGEFVHLTSRPVDGVPDPHLHAHCVVFNATHDPAEDAWKAVQFRDLKRDAPYWEAAFHSRLSRAVSELGYAVERSKHGWEVAGFSKETLDKFSRRTAEIEKLAAEKGIKTPEQKAALGAKTREAKGESRSLDALRGEWVGRLDQTERRAFVEVRGKRVRPKEPGVTADETVTHAIKHGFERQSVMSDKRLLAEALKRGYGSATPEEVKQSFTQMGQDVIRRQVNGQTLVTTKEVLAEEAQVMGFARDGRGTCKPLGKDSQGLYCDHLTAEQVAAVKHVLTSQDRVMLIHGQAGTGKTTLMKAAEKELLAAGHKMHVFAPTAEAARGILKRDGFDNAETLARLFADKQMQSRLKGGVIWVDEAGLIGMRDTRELFRIAAEQRARVVLQGDERQHHAVPRGTPFKLLQTHAGIRPAEVSSIQRQRGQYKAAVECLSRGDVQEGFARLDRMGWIKEVAEDKRHLRLADDYLAAVREKKSALVVSPTHAEGRAVTAAVRAKLKEEGRLGEQERTFRQQVNFSLTEAMKQDAVNYRKGDICQFVQNVRGFKKGERCEIVGHDAEGRVMVSRGRGQTTVLPVKDALRFELYEKRELRLAAGDKIRITQNGMSADGKHRLINGSIHTVAGFDRAGNIVLDNRQVVPKDYGNIAHGYCTTSHASQGKTVDKVLVAMGQESFGAASQQQFYVSASRGRESVTVYCGDKPELLEAVARSDERTSATELAAVGQEPPARGRLQVWRNGEVQRRLSSILGRKPNGVVQDRDSPAVVQQVQGRRREIDR